MKPYDAIVVGAGPAGATVAKIAAERGLEVILLEEHTVIGVPEHCSGVLFATTRPALTQEILGTVDKRVILQEYRALCVFAPSGKVVKEASLVGTNSYLIKRDFFDQELVRQAVKAGAELRLNTRVTGFLKKGKKVIGVTTNSSALPEVLGKIVVGTDGIYAVQRGTPNWAGLTKRGQTYVRGISFELTRVKNIEPDVFEFHAGAFIEKGWTSIFPRDSSSCVTHFTTMEEFERAKTGNYVFSQKIREAVPIRLTGWSHASDMGVGLSRFADDGLIFAGSAANLIGILPAIVSARYACEVAIEAIRNNDVSASSLSKYETMLKTMIDPKGFKKGFPFSKLSDAGIEKVLAGMLARDEFPRSKPMPI